MLLNYIHSVKILIHICLFIASSIFMFDNFIATFTNCLAMIILSCFTRQQPACVWWHWDSIWGKQRQRGPCLQCSVQTVEPPQLQREETQQDLRTGDSVRLS